MNAKMVCKALIFILHRFIIKPTLVLSLCGAGCTGYSKDSFLHVFMRNGLGGRNQIASLMQLGMVPLPTEQAQVYF